MAINLGIILMYDCSEILQINLNPSFVAIWHRLAKISISI